MYDIHSHILFDIDDGARGIDDSVELCRMAAADGVTGIVATPHIREQVWPNRRPGIEERFEEVRAELARREIGIDIVIGAEVYLASDMVAAVAEGAYPTYGDRQRYVLFELPQHFIPRQVQDVVFQFKTRNITPVLAHPERNNQMMSSLPLLEELVRMGTVLQLTAMSVTGRFGRQARKAALLLLDRNLAHVVASDAHRPGARPAILSTARKEVADRYGEARANLLFHDNPRRVIQGEDIDLYAESPRPVERGLRGVFTRLFAS